MGPRAYRLLQAYWSRLTIVARAGRYCGAAFKGTWGVTQGDPLSPTTFNVVVDVVVRHWVYVMVEGAEERYKRVQEGRHQNSLFYTDDSMVASSDSRWLQGAFSTLVGLFDRVGLLTNSGNTVGMVCLPCQAARTQSEVAYEQRMTGEGPSYRERQKRQVQCKECVKEMALGLMAGRIRMKHGQAAEERWIWSSLSPGEEPQTYWMSLLTVGVSRSCPVEGCPGRTATMTAMRVHFLHRYVRDTVVIL